MDFQTLKASVESALGRNDVPDFIYTLMMADINRDIRLVEMQKKTTLAVSGETIALPTDYMQVFSMFIDGDRRTPIIPITQESQAVRHDESGRPYYYGITKGLINFMPVPDGAYSVVMTYYAKLPDFANATDENDIINLHPGLFVYSALHQAAVWMQDIEMAMAYGTSYQNQKKLAESADMRKRIPGPMTQRPEYQL